MEFDTVLVTCYQLYNACLIIPDNLDSSTAKALKMDLLRLQASLAFAPPTPNDPTKAKLVHPTKAAATRQLDSALCHLDLFLSTKDDASEDDEDVIMRRAATR